MANLKHRFDPSIWSGVLSDGANIPDSWTDSSALAWAKRSGTTAPVFKIDSNGVPYMLANGLTANIEHATVSNLDFSYTDKITILVAWKYIEFSSGTYQFFSHGVDAGNDFGVFNRNVGTFGVGYDVVYKENNENVYNVPRLNTVRIDRSQALADEVQIRRDKANVTSGFVFGTPSSDPTGNFQSGKPLKILGFQPGAGYSFVHVGIYWVEIWDGWLTDSEVVARENVIYDIINPPPPDSTPPTDVVLGATQALGQNSARFNFTPSTDANGIQKYRFQFDKVNTFNSVDLIDEYYNGTTSPYDKTSGLSTGTTWYSRAKAVDNSANHNQSTNWSNIVSVTTWNSAPTITTASGLPDAQTGVGYVTALATTGGNGARTVSLEPGYNLPAGFNFGFDNGLNAYTISGNSAVPFSNATFRLRVTDANGQTTTKDFTLSNKDLVAPVDDTFTATAVTANRIDIAATAHDVGGGSVSSFDLEVSTTPASVATYLQAASGTNGWTSVLANQLIASLPYQHNGRNGETTYYYRIRFRDNASPANVSQWYSAQATTPAAPVSVDFALSSSAIEASDSLSVTNNSLNATSYEWKVNGTVRSVSTNPNLTKWLKMGLNTIELKATNSGGSDTLQKTVTVSKKYVNVGTDLSLVLSGLQSGQYLKTKVRAYDGAGNVSNWSGTAENTTT